MEFSARKTCVRGRGRGRGRGRMRRRVRVRDRVRVRGRALTGAISKTRPMSEAIAICLYSCGDWARHAPCPK